jgi:hypothetical protein
MKVISFRADGLPRVVELTDQEQEASCLFHACLDDGMSGFDALNFVGNQPQFSDLTSEAQDCAEFVAWLTALCARVARNKETACGTNPGPGCWRKSARSA